MTEKINNKINKDSKTQKLLILSGIVDFLLGIGKLAVGILANSHALIADGIHSLSDLATDIMVWFFNSVGLQEPDDDHPYGHARFETFGTLILGGALILVASLLIYDSLDRLMNIAEVQIPTWPALLAATASIIAKEWLYFITKKRATEIRSNLLVANAWHHRSDSLSSILVLLGVGGAMMGVTWLEMVAAIGVALMIGQIGWSLGKQSMDELVDTALSQADVDELKKTVMAAEGVRGVHNIRTRKMGNDVLLDVHLQVNPAVSVSEGHHIGEWVTRDLLLRFDFLADIIVHIDAEDDELVEVRELSEYEIPPLRHDVRLTLMTCWKDFIDPEDVLKLTLHYLNRGINAELYLPMDKYGANASELHQQLLQAASNVKWLRRLNIWFA